MSKKKKPATEKIAVKHSKEESYQLPNGLSIFHLNLYETDFVYHEIFEEQVYLKQGITLRPGDCVFDIGANIGLFSLYILEREPGARVYAFEPAPELHELLRLNTAPYGDRVKTFPNGIADENRRATFTFYPQYSILSGFAADPREDEKLLRAGIAAPDRSAGEFENEILDKLAAEKLKGEKKYTCELKTISRVIAEEKIQAIDLLKIDAERSELKILQGIDSQDWSKIKQIVMEIHDLQGLVLEEIKNLLDERGYALEIREESHFDKTGIVNLYARKSSPREKLYIAATFTAEPMQPALEFWLRELAGLGLEVHFAPYNQVFQELLNPAGGMAANPSGMNVILVKFDDWLRFREKVTGQKSGMTPEEAEHLRASFKEFLAGLAAYADRAAAFTLIMLCPPAAPFHNEPTFQTLAREFQRELADFTTRRSLLTFLSAADYHSAYRVETVLDSFTDRMGHIPYTTTYYHFLATLVMRRLYSSKQKSCKAIVLDADNTLWQGVCGEVGAKGVTIEGLYKNFQQFLVRKT
ncbi:MAG: FkbM family methyltransferase, partial [Acidobacteriota bacterium]|nr:FkbM family methyltransferase [Acidobacteriota bacterium]